MRIKSWIQVTEVEDSGNIRVDDDFYNSEIDNEKVIDYVYVQDNGVVCIHTKPERSKDGETDRKNC